MTAMLEKLIAAIAAELERQIAPQIADHAAGKWGSAHSHFSGPSAIFGTCQVNGEVDIKAVARAALMAVREPDAVMIKAGDDAMEGFMDDDLAPIFTAMIDAILNEEKAPAA